MASIINSRRWFHANINGQQAESLLKAFDVEDGTFLVRPSSQGDFTLSVRRGPDKVTHIRIQKNADDCFDLHGGEAFASLAELIQYYMENPSQLKEKNGEEIPLKYPLYANDPTTERWFHVSISGKQAEQLLKEQGKNGSFLVRESQSTAGSYAISLRTDDAQAQMPVTHVMINCRNGKYDVGGGDQFKSLSDLVEHYRKNPMVESSGTVMHLKLPFNSTRVWAMELKKKIDSMDKMDVSKGRTGFWEEFEVLLVLHCLSEDPLSQPRDETAVQQNECKHWYTRRDGQKPENRPKNRYKNIWPYDHTRVVLKDADPTLPGSDYINANLIQVLPEYEEFVGISRSYISAQGCIPNTVDDFWRMIWQENCRMIVMTTKETERGRSKCVKYWPDFGQTKQHGLKQELSLTNTVEETTNDFMLRKFILTHKGSDERRVIYHYQFLAWPDHGVPGDPGSVLNFLEEFNKCLDTHAPNTGPVLVHCSAGIGRTGTFIAIDLVLNMLKKNGLNCVIDISRTVQMIRSQRSGMVQTEAQYKFVYMAVEHYIETVSKHLAEHKRLEPTGREYTNIRYTADIAAASNGQLTPTSPVETPVFLDNTDSTPHSTPGRRSPEIKPLKLDPPPPSKKGTRVN